MEFLRIFLLTLVLLVCGFAILALALYTVYLGINVSPYYFLITLFVIALVMTIYVVTI